MRTGWLRGSVRDFWADEEPGPAARLLGAALVPAEASFRMAVAAKNAWHDRWPPPGTPIPVVSVGNLTVGGTGKTPVVRWLADWLRRSGTRVATVTRGYGLDEAALHRRWSGEGAVFSGRDRLGSVREAADRGYGVAVVDDGFQHRRLSRALDVLLVAVEDPLVARLLPRGPYRESPAAARRATHILLTRRTSRPERAAAWRRRLARMAPGVPILDVRIAMGGWSDLSGVPDAPPEGDVLAVCSIARPAPFRSGLAELLPLAAIELVAYADHHAYTHRDVSALVERLGDRTLVCTAKDAVKLARYREMVPRCAVVGLSVAGEPQEPLRGALTELVRSRCTSR